MISHENFLTLDFWIALTKWLSLLRDIPKRNIPSLALFLEPTLIAMIDSKIEKDKVSFTELPDDTQQMIISICTDFNNLQPHEKLELIGEISKLKNPPAVFVEIKSQFSLSLKTYVDNYQSCTAAQCQQHWCTVVGGEQFKTVAHVAQHYCEPDVPFDPQPSFKAETFKRTLDFHNYVTDKPEKWWMPGAGVSTAGLGSSFGIVNGAWGARPLLRGGASVPVDLAALTAMWKVRTEEDLPQLKQQLRGNCRGPRVSTIIPKPD